MKNSTELKKRIEELKHELYLYETSPEDHISEKRIIPSLKDQISLLEGQLGTFLVLNTSTNEIILRTDNKEEAINTAESTAASYDKDNVFFDVFENDVRIARFCDQERIK